jgi:two-component system response regulator NreC
MNDISIALADDHNVVRQGLRSLLEKEPCFRIVGEASDGSAVLQLVKKHNPDVLILDLMMPIMNGIEATKKITQASPETRVLILSMYNNEAYVAEAFKAGAQGYVLKDVIGPELVKAVRDVSEGRRYLSPPLSEHAIEWYVSKTAATGIDLYETLTDREREILYLVGEGLKSSEIAEQLTIKPRTVETHRSNIMRKLAMTNQAALIRCALQRQTNLQL